MGQAAAIDHRDRQGNLDVNEGDGLVPGNGNEMYESQAVPNRSK